MAGASLDGAAVIVGVDGAGRTHRLDQIAAATSRRVLRVNPPVLDTDRLAEDLAEIGDGLVLVDDAHRLDPTELALLTAAARRGVSLVVARRPTIGGPAHADLDEAVGGRVERLAPLDVDAVTALVRARTGRSVGPDEAAALHVASAGLPIVLLAVAAGPDPASPTRAWSPASTVDSLDSSRQSPRWPACWPCGSTCRTPCWRRRPIWTVPGSVPPCGSCADEGLLAPGTETMIPAVAEAVLADLPAAERRRAHEAVARALVAAGADVLAAATQLRAARAFVPAVGGGVRGRR